MKKRVLAMLLALIQCFSLLIIPAHAAEAAVVSVSADKQTVYRGDSVTVTVKLDSNPGMAYWSLDPDYNEDIFEVGTFVKAPACTLNPTIVKRAVFGGYAYNEMYSGDILNITFNVKADAAYGEYDLGVFLTEAYTVDLDDVDFNITNTRVIVAPKPVSGITMDQSELALNQGDTATLVATVLPEDADDKTVTWSTSADNVATVTDGVVTAVGPGSATITAKAGEFEATCAVTVAGANVPVTGITINKPAVNQMGKVGILAGDSVTLTATVTPDYATDKMVTWTSSNEAVATVEDGVVTGVAFGTATITAKSGDCSATCNVDVVGNYFTVTADDAEMDLIYIADKSQPGSFNRFRVDVPAGTDTVVLSGQITGWKIYTGTSIVDGAMTIDLNTYTGKESASIIPYYGVESKPNSQWKVSLSTKKTVDKYNEEMVILINMLPCEGEHFWTAATCTAPKTCSVCRTTEGEALGHDWEVTAEEVPAVCETPGTTAIETCDRCQTTQGGETITAPGHKWRFVKNTKEPNCTEKGEKLFTCVTCPEENAASKTEEITELGHKWDEGEVTTQPTCTATGVKTFGCTVCEEGSKTEDVPANGHTYVDGYCSVDGCGVMEPTVIPMTNANHTSTGSVLGGTMYAGIEGLEISGIKLSDWSEWSISGLNRTITVYVDPVYKNETATLRMLAKTGYNGTSLFNTPANVQLVDGVYNYRANAVKIDANGIPTQLQFNLIVNFALGKCTGEHTWLEATCEEPKTCELCGETEGEALGHDWNAESVCRREGCGASNKITEIELTHPNLKSEAMTMVTGTNEKITVSFNAVDNKVGATQVVAWFSSDETVATVADGVVTALKAGTTTITAKAVDANGIALLADGEEVLAQFTLTVEEPGAGYTVTMGGDIVNAVIGSDISVPVTVGHTGEVTKYNAFDFTFEYDPAVLELTSTEITGMTVTVKDGKIHVERYGTALTVGETALTLTFKAVATGESNVKVTSAKVDISEAALTQDAPDASVIDNITLVSVAGYTVSLPTEFKGESSVLPGENYTFEAKDKNYVYTVKATIDGNEIPVTDNGNGTFTIAADKITGNVVITTEKSGKVVNVKLGDDMTGNPTAQYMTAYTATLTKAAGYNYNVTVEIGGQKFTGFTYDDATGLVTIPGEAITGEIVFNSNKTAQAVDMHNIEFAGEYGDIAEDTKLDVANGSDYTLTINKVVGYKYTVTATMNGEAVEVTDNGDGTYTIKNVTGDLKITIAKEYDLAVEVAEYVTLNGKTMFLVTATGSVDEGKVLAYGGTAMFWSNQYNAWSYLVITDSTLSVEDAKAQITLNEGTKVELDQTYNVNETANNTVDINDAQLVYDLYNNVYQDIETVGMQKFLKADVNGDKTINVNDAAAVVSEIVKNK